MTSGAQTLEVAWKAQAGGQVKFLKSPVFETLIEGDRGGGKTTALLVSYLQHVGPQLHAGMPAGFGRHWRGVIFRRTYKELQDIIEKSHMLVPAIFPDAVYNASEHFWRFKTGESLLFRQVMTMRDYRDYHGHEYPFVGFEELTSWPEESVYTMFMSLCRSSFQGNIPLKIRATTNPAGPGHGWVKNRFRLPVRAGQLCGDLIHPEGEKPRIAVTSSWRENTAMLATVPDYEQQLKMAAKDPGLARAWIHGDWDIVQGGMFDDVWDQSVHIVTPFDIPKSWRIDRSFDWGSSAPFAVSWWAQSDGSDLTLADGRVISTVRDDLYNIAEWYGWNGEPNKGCKMLAKDIAKGIVEREIEAGIHRRVQSGPADNSIFDVTNNMSIAADMSKPIRIDAKQYQGVRWLRSNKSPGSRATGYQHMRAMFSGAKPNEDGSPREHPGLFVFSHCRHFIRTIPVLQRDVDRNPDDTPKEAEDHIADEVRYRILNLNLGNISNAFTGMAY